MRPEVEVIEKCWDAGIGFEFEGFEGFEGFTRFPGDLDSADFVGVDIWLGDLADLAEFDDLGDSSEPELDE